MREYMKKRRQAERDAKAGPPPAPVGFNDFQLGQLREIVQSIVRSELETAFTSVNVNRPEPTPVLDESQLTDVDVNSVNMPEPASLQTGKLCRVCGGPVFRNKPTGRDPYYCSPECKQRWVKG